MSNACSTISTSTGTFPYVGSVLTLQKYCLQNDIGINFLLIGGDALIPRVRNILVQQFLAHPDATHLLFIDADIGFRPEQVQALLAADKDVCGAIYPLKGLEWERITTMVRAGATEVRPSAMNYVVEWLAPGEIRPADDFVRARYIGGGFMMIKRSVFSRMAEHYPGTKYRGIGVSVNIDISQTAHAFFDCVIDPDTGIYLSEDYTFCKLWTDMGGEIWAYAKSCLTHVGQHAFEGDLMAMLQTTSKG